ncbi:myosin-IIIb [Caerostris darwini]|uniref:Myosin-IIIb n=1 Tax=Caerostris darwini TaxID=1538125 RepID=A0AAV4W2W5_9ARAC|nr:myosin-IIIb [Caerostris darwini]
MIRCLFSIQVIITFGKCGSGKSFSTTQIIKQLAFLSPSGNIGMAEKIQQLCPLLDAFGSARTAYNQNASRLLKTVAVTFTKTGKITGGIITAILLDRTRITSIPENEGNFHVLYYVFEGLKSEKRLAEFGLDKLSAMRALPSKPSRSAADLVAGYKALYHSFRVLSFTEEEILVVLRILAAILLLGDVTYTMKGQTATANNPYLVTRQEPERRPRAAVLRDLQGCGGGGGGGQEGRLGAVPIPEGVRLDRLLHQQAALILPPRPVSSTPLSEINRNLVFILICCLSVCRIVEVASPGVFRRTDASCVFSQGELVLGDRGGSPGVREPRAEPALPTHHQHHQRLPAEVHPAAALLQGTGELTPFLSTHPPSEEYKEEGVDIPFKYEETPQQKEFLDSLVESERILLNGLQNSGVKGTFNWLKKMKSLPSECIRVENDTVTVKHTFEEVTYSIPDLTTENVGSPDEEEFAETFKGTVDVVTSAIANLVRRVAEFENAFLVHW